MYMYVSIHVHGSHELECSRQALGREGGRGRPRERGVERRERERKSEIERRERPRKERGGGGENERMVWKIQCKPTELRVRTWM